MNITGGGSGIGRATCKLFAQNGAQVVVADQNENQAKSTLSQLSNDSNTLKHLGVLVNVSESKSINEILNKILETYQQPPSIIVNSAGITRDNFLLKMSEQDFQQVIDVNLKGTFLVIQAFANSIIQHGIKSASIVNIASIVGKYGNVGQANYSASKSGVELLTRTASKELSQFGIRVNVVLPGMISTPMTDAVPDKVKAKFMQMIPLNRFGDPSGNELNQLYYIFPTYVSFISEVAEVINFLASDKSSYVNGASIDVTGGF